MTQRDFLTQLINVDVRSKANMLDIIFFRAKLNQKYRTHTNPLIYIQALLHKTLHATKTLQFDIPLNNVNFR